MRIPRRAGPGRGASVVQWLGSSRVRGGGAWADGTGRNARVLRKRRTLAPRHGPEESVTCSSVRPGHTCDGSMNHACLMRVQFPSQDAACEEQSFSSHLCASGAVGMIAVVRESTL